MIIAYIKKSLVLKFQILTDILGTKRKIEEVGLPLNLFI